MKRLRTAAVLFAGLTAVMAAEPVMAQNYPERPVRIVIPVPPGGMMGNMANLIGSHLQQRLGQNFVVDPRPGGGGAIAFEQVKNARPDGYTLLLGTISNSAILPAIRDDLPYDILNDYTPLTHLVSGESVFVVPAASPINSLDELIAYGREDGNPTCGTHGMSSTPHLACALLNTSYGTRFTVIHYTGSAPALTALVGGETAMLFATTDAIEFILNGSLRALAVTSDERMAELPDVPTTDELGYPDLKVSAWYGIYAPAGISEDVKGVLSGALADAMKSEEWLKSISAVRMSPSPDSSPEAFDALIRSELERWDPIAKAAVADGN